VPDTTSGVADGKTFPLQTY